MKAFDAFIFDLNGTMIDDMQYHITAWHEIFNHLGYHVSREEAAKECYGKNVEILERIFPGRFSEEEKNKISVEKETKYQADFRSHLQLIPGLLSLLQTAKKEGIKTAIGSAAIMYNVDFVLDGLNIRNLIDAIVSADDVINSKPNLETFLTCSEKLAIPADKCVVFEDAPTGVQAAADAGMKSVVIKTSHSIDEFSGFRNILGFIETYEDALLKTLF